MSRVKKTEPVDGLHFSCVKGCTNCCDQKGFVYLSETDLHKAAKFTRLSVEEFESKYVYRTKHLIRLRKPQNSQCHFLIDGGCAIHPAKPTQCRLFPFWPELVENREGWASAAQYCPGIGQGPLIQIGTAVETAQEMKTAYPFDYED